MKSKSDEAGAWFAIAMMAGILFAQCSSEAQEARPTRAERRLVELVAKVSFNEGLDSYPDLALIYQIVSGHGDTARERVRWLEQHSRCVSGVLTQDRAYERPGNCHWTRNLMPDGRRPRGFHDCHDEDRDGEHDEAHCDGRWSRIRPRWLAHLERVRAFISGADTYRPCATTPHSWDGTRYGRDTVEGRGHTIVECDVVYTESPSEEGLHNFAVIWRTRPAARD